MVALWMVSGFNFVLIFISKIFYKEPFPHVNLKTLIKTAPSLWKTDSLAKMPNAIRDHREWLHWDKKIDSAEGKWLILEKERDRGKPWGLSLAFSHYQLSLHNIQPFLSMPLSTLYLNPVVTDCLISSNISLSPCSFYGRPVTGNCGNNSCSWFLEGMKQAERCLWPVSSLMRLHILLHKCNQEWGCAVLITAKIGTWNSKDAISIASLY